MFDKDMKFYSRRHLLSDQSDDVKFYFQDVEQWLDNKLRVKFSLYNELEIPVLIRNIMSQFKAKHCLLMRLNESDNSSIVMLLLNSSVDILDYRVSFVQMFLRQSEIFYQYQH